MMHLVITEDDRVWRGSARVFDEAIAVLKVHWEAELAKDPHATLVVDLKAEPAPPPRKGPYG